MTGTASPAAQTLVAAARRNLGMDVAFVAEFTGGRRVFRFVDRAEGAARLEVGGGDELADTYCRQIVEGETPGIIPDTSAEPTVRNLAVTSQLGIAAYVGVPVRYSDGRIFGTLCCISHSTRADLGEAELRYLAVLAEAVAADIEAGEQADSRRIEARLRIEGVIRERLFHPVFQPIVHAATGATVGLEALTRFTADDRPPLAWFAEAAMLGLAGDLEVATAQAAVAAFDAGGDVFCAINLSPGALTRLDEILAGCPVSPERLVVEITEQTTVVDYPEMRKTTELFRSRGVRFAVDDTGAGIASLGHILELAPDIIKLDRTLTDRIDSDLARQALARALVVFAADISGTIVAEGIETPEQLATIVDVGVPLAQGFHIGRPRPAATPPPSRS